MILPENANFVFYDTIISLLTVQATRAVQLAVRYWRERGGGVGGRAAGVARQVPDPGPARHSQPHQDLQAQAQAQHQEGRRAGRAAHLQGRYRSVIDYLIFAQKKL